MSLSLARRVIIAAGLPVTLVAVSFASGGPAAPPPTVPVSVATYRTVPPVIPATSTTLVATNGTLPATDPVQPCPGTTVTVAVDEPVGCDVIPPQRLDVTGATRQECADMGGDLELYDDGEGECPGVDY